MRKILLTILLTLLSLPLFAENNILVVGDSISAGFGFNPKLGWVTLLQQRLYQKNYLYHVVNISVSGNTTSNGLAAIQNALTEYHPKVTIIELGANDGLRGVSPLIIKTNLEKMIALSLVSGSKVLVLGLRLPPNYGQAYNDQFLQIYTDLSKRTDIRVLPLFLNTIDDNTTLMQADHLHPGIGAQTILLDNVWGDLEKLLQP